ncbi:MAG: hypothetical protein ACREHC_01265 [Candidatus Levyibacteriota bacterium]
MTPIIIDIDGMIRHRWESINYVADTYARFYMHPRSKAVLEDIATAKAENEETDRDMRDVIRKGNLRYV